MASEPKVYALEEVAKHNVKKDCWLIMFGKVYDVTEFLDDHPGGDDVVISSTGKDATNDFEDVGHSKTATNMLDKYYIGDIDPTTMKTPAYVAPIPKATTTADNGPGFIIRILQMLVPVVILGLAFAVRKYTKPE
ncbi:uncharacterized protein A4U43_C08F380 [Asparagus officinalis]|uniref:cytochrome b5-like n=1 Tax=Asparagus officinalis TaxID=4686 RepID=UPI00098E66CA|nr:cytochrome b5-like [Asparagus officinalis]ONK58850.1 uncharacterized protein A4U43_C08F380 [Asparagus officinalis]